LDGELTAKQAAESFAYKELVQDALHKALVNVSVEVLEYFYFSLCVVVLSVAGC